MVKLSHSKTYSIPLSRSITPAISFAALGLAAASLSASILALASRSLSPSGVSASRNFRICAGSNDIDGPLRLALAHLHLGVHHRVEIIEACLVVGLVFLDLGLELFDPHQKIGLLLLRHLRALRLGLCRLLRLVGRRIDVIDFRIWDQVEPQIIAHLLVQ